MKLSEYIFDLITSRNPNLIGEILREKFFNQDREKGKFGCYSTFELRQNVIKLPSFIEKDPHFPDIETVWTCAQLDDIIMRYYWDGDGVLEFVFPNNEILANNDCKKPYWKWGRDLY